jgi:hypothetical protein
LVYQKIIEFYKVAIEVLADSGAKMVLRMMLNNVRLPEIVGEFLQRTGALHKLVVNATHEILVEVKTMLYERESRDTCKDIWQGSFVNRLQFPNGLGVRSCSSSTNAMQICKLSALIALASSCCKTKDLPDGAISLIVASS